MTTGTTGAADPISGRPNRRRFLEDHEVAPAGPAAILLVTLSTAPAFNAILRALGHDRSEAFIRAGADRLGEVLGPDAPLYHVSILSFVCVLPVARDAGEPAVVSRIRRAFASPLVCDDIPIDARVGIGLAEMAAAPEALRAESLRAALTAAQDSRERAEGWAWYDPRSDAAHRRAFGLLTDLKAALDRPDQLHLAFQPKVALATGDAPAAEALVRWRHPTLGPVSPGEFVPLAEATALLRPLTRWVISAAAAQIVAWDRAGLEIGLAINVSPKNLREPDFVEYLLFVCAAARIDRGRIELEVTEGVNADDGGSAILGRLATLRRLGFRIAIDDFGSGYSNMSYLNRLSAQTLKIDQSLVRGVTAGTPEGKLLAGIVQMGHDLGYGIVAEGIETEAERALLTALGADYGQGYLFGKPMSGDDLLDWRRVRRAG